VFPHQGSGNWKIETGVESQREARPSLLLFHVVFSFAFSIFQLLVSSFRLRIPILAEETDAPLENRRGLRIKSGIIGFIKRIDWTPRDDGFTKVIKTR
jgi:hypothetical protein